MFNVPFTGSAPVKPATEYKLVGTPVARRDMPAKVSGKHVYMQHVRVPGMMHARVVRPRGQGAYGDGAKVLRIDESSIRSIAGLAGFFILIQLMEQPERYGRSRRFDAMPSSSILQVFLNATQSREGA